MKRLRHRPDPEKDALERRGHYITVGELLLTDYEWNHGDTPTEKQLEARRREVGKAIVQGEVTITPLERQQKKHDVLQVIELRAKAPIRAKVEQADLSDTPLFGQGQLL